MATEGWVWQDEDDEGPTEERRLVQQVREGLRQIGELTAARELAPKSWQRAQWAVVEMLVGESSRLAKLSEREQEVWRLWCEGSSAKEVAELLVLSDNTVNTHLQHVRRKLNLWDVREVVVRRRQLVGGQNTENW